MRDYLKNNPGKSFRASPFHAPLKAWALVPFFILFSAAVGFGSGLLKYELLDSKIVAILPFTLFIFPAFLEELLFRGVLIPRNIIDSGRAKTFRAIGFSTLAFVVWHPVNALLLNGSAIPLFLDPWFLVIVTALGITCGYSYAVSKSIWVSVIIHWVTVTVWGLLLGGRNLVLAQ
ncbi:CPBP family glutamic-type intramembrane protease [Solemya elarraichensis gill symbiont]|uniref:CAAX prenyl protease 2/Lysostaphin resistance protein A-like domain-containing protein n=1 Tax=Solemya elarraichensis gill symbiont TaxID=1918949 RepID=A0A1T2LC00_9GAMM|nr:CPBP family glutamic-type intramembrane protease [Solemya elarraichensis gill symbiont]OOZ42627.1 hypothetical protein BOW52_02240 [Solemya elarraichensis gill symbiont]